MGFFVAFGAGLRELVLLRHAESAARALGQEGVGRVRAHVVAAKVRAGAARTLASPQAAIVLLKDALRHALEAASLVSSATGGPPRGTVEDVAPGAPAALAAHLERVRAHLHHADALAADRLPFRDAEDLRSSLGRVVAHVLTFAPSRNLTEVRGLRAGRVLAIALVLLGAPALWAHGRFGLQNVALDKPVLTTSLKHDPPAPSAVVDGRTHGTFGVHTNTQAHPFVEVDLQRSYRVERVKVYNRGDGWFDDILPLSLEVSEDGRSFHEVARRTEHFDVWTVDLPKVPARYVRVTKDQGYIALNEIEVYAHR